MLKRQLQRTLRDEKNKAQVKDAGGKRKKRNRRRERNKEYNALTVLEKQILKVADESKFGEWNERIMRKLEKCTSESTREEQRKVAMMEAEREHRRRDVLEKPEADYSDEESSF